MIVDTKKVKNNVLELKKIIKKYELNCLNFNNCFKQTSDYWSGNVSKMFFKQVNCDSNKYINCIDELKSIVDMLLLFVEKYEIIGQKIIYNFDIRNRILDILNLYISEISCIINLYNNIDSKYISYIENQIKYFYQLSDYIAYIKNKYNSIYDSINSIDNYAGAKFSKFNVEIIKETSIETFI